MAKPVPIVVVILGSVLCAMICIGFVTIFCVVKKLKREKLKKQLAEATTRKVVVTHWTKKIIVEKTKLENSNTGDTVLEPLVNSSFFFNFNFCSI